MDMNKVFERLCKLAAMRGSHRDPILVCDLVDQDNLFEIQNALSGLLFDVAKSLGTDKLDVLVKKFPYAFKAPAKGGAK